MIAFKNRIVLVIIAIVISSIMFLPIWFINLKAPQYPEGVTMFIYSHYVGGQLQIVNALNHYVGMHEIVNDDFPEFAFLNYIFIAFAILFIFAAIIGKRILLYITTFFYFLFAVAILIDFYIWEYKYGHDLNPLAPIRIPGFSFQPPLFGSKQVLNFYITSLPSIGGCIFIIVQLILIYVSYKEYRISKKIAN